MRRIAVMLGLLALLLPMSAWAAGLDLINQFGTVTITNAGIASRGSELIRINRITAPPGRALGSVSFSTGALLKGNIWSGAKFSSMGSSFVVIGVGHYGQPKGVIFDGAFVGPISWRVVSQTGKYSYVFKLSGSIRGQLYNGQMTVATTTQTIYAYQNPR